jgi:serine/threonine protein kinase/tetratricopeptide (TPR) repeat protein
VDEGTDETLPPATLPPGIVVGGKFTLLRLIAQGGVGSVYEAEDAIIGRRVALKVLHPQLARHAEITRRFLREAKATASIDHPHVVTVLEMGIQPDGTLFIVHELLRGNSLRQRLAAAGRIDVDEALQIALPIADALAAAHRKGVIHRDIKPDNILLARNSGSELWPKLIDFGVAKMRATDSKGFATLTGTLLGTTAYMSPEQARGDATIDGRADVWGLATVLFEALSGQCPYDGPTQHAILVKILTATGPPSWPEGTASIPNELLETIRAGLALDARRRPPMHAFRERLLACFEGRGRVLAVLPAGPTDPGSAAREPGERSPLEDILEPGPEDLDVDLDHERPARGVPTRIGTPASHPEIEWKPDGAPPRPAAEEIAELAEDALRVNALDEAMAHANRAIAEGAADPSLVGRMHLTQAIASHWLGHYETADMLAGAAMEELEPATTGWYAALGHVAMASGHRGHGARLGALAAELARARGDHPGRVIAACRLIVQLVRTGAPDRARELSSSLDESGAGRTAGEPFVRAWIAVARAELAVHDGDPMRYMELVKDAVDDFVAAGDIRNASLQRSNIGNAYLQLGGYRQAERVLAEAVSTAEPMKLSFAAGARANLGFALSRMGHHEQGIAVELEALDRFGGQGNRRFEAIAHLYLALMRAAAGKTADAETSARAAVLAADGIPGIRAYALAVLAHQLLESGRTPEGVESAGQAATLLEQQSGVEEGESWIRFVNALAIAQSGNPGAAARLILDAKVRLLERANRITDPRWRESFLRNIPEHAQTLAFAKLWGAGKS